jgi:hypothetical protein
MFSLSDIETAISNGAQRLIHLAAGATSSIAAIESSSPLVTSAISLVEQEFPAIRAGVAVEQAVLGMAQDLVTKTQAAAAAVPPAAAT